MLLAGGVQSRGRIPPFIPAPYQRVSEVLNKYKKNGELASEVHVSEVIFFINHVPMTLGM